MEDIKTILDNMKNCTSIHIKADNMLYIASFVKVRDDNAIEVIINNREFAATSKELLAEICCGNGLKSFKYNVKVTVRLVNETLGLHYLYIINIKKLERRNYVRVNTSDTISILQEGEKTKEVKMIDISEGGLCFVTNDDTIKGDILFRYKADASTILTLKGKILCKHETGSYLNKYMYHLQFKDLLPSEQSVLRKVIFTLQRQMLKQRSGM